MCVWVCVCYISVSVSVVSVSRGLLPRLSYLACGMALTMPGRSGLAGTAMPKRPG